MLSSTKQSREVIGFLVREADGSFSSITLTGALSPFLEHEDKAGWLQMQTPLSLSLGLPATSDGIVLLGRLLKATETYISSLPVSWELIDRLQKAIPSNLFTVESPVPKESEPITKRLETLTLKSLKNKVDG